MRLHGIRIPHKKNTAAMPPLRVELPKTVTIPMLMHIGKHARAVVAPGDSVKVGQIIGAADGYISSDIHSSVSGTVTKLVELTAFNGNKVSCVQIECDGKQELDPTLRIPEVTDFDSFVTAVKASGVVGLGGAGFPSFVKLGVGDLSKIDAIILNGAECEPYITSDTRTMIDKADYLLKGIRALQTFMNAKRIIIGIENNKKEAILKMRELAARTEGVEVKVLPSVYPQGGEKVLIYHTIHRLVPKGGLPLDVGAVVINVTTLAFIAEYLETGVPLIEKCITVDGSAMKEPKNVIAPIGMTIADLLTAAGGVKEEPAKVIYGGPMMGIAMQSLEEPVLKITNAVIAMGKKEATLPKITPCIGCGGCIAHCPFRLDPRAIAKAYQHKDVQALEKLCVDMCMECGCCSYTCPANRPLVHTNKLAKAMLKAYRAEKETKK